MGADLVQPALVDILKQRIGDAVGLRGNRGAVEADHDPVAALLLEDHVAQQRLELRLVPPRVELGIADGVVEIGLAAEIAAIVGGVGRVGGRAAVARCGVGAPGQRAGDGHPHFGALLLGHAHDVDLLEEVARFLDLSSSVCSTTGATLNLATVSSGSIPFRRAIWLT
jgi:hypothetical protein